MKSTNSAFLEIKDRMTVGLKTSVDIRQNQAHVSARCTKEMKTKEYKQFAAHPKYMVLNNGAVTLSDNCCRGTFTEATITN